MGLDMYLNAERHYSKWLGDETIPTIPEMPEGFSVEIVSTQVAYWRKANAIHDWFVKNVQDGEDECRRHYASREQLQDLVDTCGKVLILPDLAQELLPTTSGFFFGGTEYDEYYLDMLRYTRDTLTKVLSVFPENNWDFYYQSSW